MRSLWIVAVAAVTLAGCAKAETTASSTPAPGAAKIGYVRMEQLVKVHPLYGQLARYDRNIEALSLKGMPSDVPRSGAEIAKADAELDRELKTAAQRTNALLKSKQDEYIKRESAAITAALAGARGASGPSGAQIASNVQNVANAQSQAAIGQATKNFEQYRDTLIKQDRAQVAAATNAINERSTREYRAKAAELQAKESAFSLDLATKDAAERLSLRTRLSNLALDDTTRDQTRAELTAIDRKEADAVAALRNRDQQTLTQLSAQIKAQGQRDLQKQVAVIRSQTDAKLHQREALTRAQLGAQQVAVTGGTAPTKATIPADLQQKIKALHDTYQTQFKKDAAATIASYNKTRVELQHRFDKLHGVNAEAQDRTQRELAGLQKQRESLYDQMIAQISGQVRVLAKNRGYALVFTNIVAPAAGTDLTADAEKEIESLHE